MIIEDNKGNVRFTYGNVETSENKPSKVEVKEIKAEEKKTPKKTQKQADNGFTSASELPFENVVNKFVEIHKQEDDIETLENLREMINDVNMSIFLFVSFFIDILFFEQIISRNAYSYYAKQYDKPNFSELNVKELENVVKELDRIIEENEKKRGINA